MADFGNALLMYLVVTILGAFAVPLCSVVFSRIRGGSVLLARPMALLLITYMAWVGATIHLLPFNRLGLTVCATVVLIGSALYVFSRMDSLIARLKEDLPVIWRGELIFFIAFCVAVFFKMNRTMIYGTEKYMDLAFFASIFRGASMPPVDPWLAGFSINYYYGGYMIFAGLAKLAGVSLGVGYNLAFALVFAFVASSVYCLVHSLTKSHWMGVLGCALHSLLGNMEGAVLFFRQLLSGLADQTSSATQLFKWFFSGFHPIQLWKTTRVVVDATGGETINEYPLFTFYWGDLHPHLSSMPFVILVIALVWNLFKAPRERSLFQMILEDWPSLLFLSLATGALAMINGLDFPTFLLLGCASLFLRELLSAFSAKQDSASEKLYFGITRSIVLPIALVGLSWVLFSPFFLGYEAPKQKEGLLALTAFRTDFFEYLRVFGLFFFVVVVYVVWRTVTSFNQQTKTIGSLALAFVGVLFLVGAGFEGYILVPVLTTLAAALVYLIVLALRRSPARAFSLLLILLAVGISIGCERIYVRDGYGDDLQRMNTLFKFYLQVWVLFAIATPCLLHELVRDKSLNLGSRVGTTIVFGFLCLLGCITTYSTVRQIVEEHRADQKKGIQGPITLDGQDYLKYQRPDKSEKWPGKAGGPSDEYNAIKWLLDLDGQPVIAEATGDPYRYWGRVSANTGLPTILGWFNHESVWRKDASEKKPGEATAKKNIYDICNERKADVEKIYKSTNVSEAKTLLDKYSARYVYVGPMEREAYSGAGLEKFDQAGWKKAFTSSGVNIYEVP